MDKAQKYTDKAIAQIDKLKNSAALVSILRNFLFVNLCWTKIS